MKVPRSKNEPGKGGFWRLDTERAESLAGGTLKRKKPTKLSAYPSDMIKRSRIENDPLSPQQLEQSARKEQFDATANGMQYNEGYVTTTVLDPLDRSDALLHHPSPFIPPPPADFNSGVLQNVFNRTIVRFFKSIYRSFHYFNCRPWFRTLGPHNRTIQNVR